MPLSASQKEQLINNLISGVNGEGPWTEDDRLALNAIPECKLEALEKHRLLALNAKAVEPDEEEEDDEGEEDEMPAFIKKKIATKNAATTTTNAQQARPARPTRPLNPQEWLRQTNAPPEVCSAVNNALAFEAQQKQELIEKITSNERNQFTDEFLQSQQLPVLQGLAALAVNEVQQSLTNRVLMPHFSGLPAPQQTVNEGFEREDLDMALQPMDWSNPN